MNQNNRAISAIRDLFPALSQKMNGENLVYLDNAATTQKPKDVLNLLSQMSIYKNANVHRSMYQLSDEATALYEQARENVRRFINAPQRENIIFTSGTTASINLVASSFCEAFLKKGETILIGADSHHSNIVPWQLAAQRVGGRVKIIPVNKNGEIEVGELGSLIDDSVRIISICHISNITGIISPISKIIQIAHSKGVPVLIDGAQGIVHSSVDVKELDCDFYAFSAHKIYGATGCGILYGKRELLEKMPPYMGGGDMVHTVTYQHTTYAPLPLKFEAGTPNFIGASSLTPALKFANSVLGKGEDYFTQFSNKELFEAVESEKNNIVEYILDALKNEVGDVEIYGETEDIKNKIALFSFNIKGINSSDIAQLLDKMGIAIRSGLMCAEPLLNFFGCNGAVRASFAPYNTLEEAKLFIKSLCRAKKMLL